MTLTVINGKTHGFIGKDKIYIGRTNTHLGLRGSALANPYCIGRDGDRNQVIQLYRKWLWDRFNQAFEIGNLSFELTPEVIEIHSIARKVQAGKNVQLTCYCKPAACHGDVIVSCVNWFIQENIERKI